MAGPMECKEAGTAGAFCCGGTEPEPRMGLEVALIVSSGGSGAEVEAQW